MRARLFLVLCLALLCLGTLARADVFDLETVTVADPGNVGELSGTGAGGVGPNRICGAVSYTYRIAKYEITAGQYCDFLNHKAKSDPNGLYNTAMWGSQGCKIQRSGSSPNYSYSVASDWANRPVNYVSYWDACRFANWLHNGQGDTETGAYTLNNYKSTDGRTIQRNPGALWYLPNEDEWYKAAYYKGGGMNAGYWDYPMQSNLPTVPSNDLIDPDLGNNANFTQSGGQTIGSPYYRTVAGEFENSESAYGTFDQGGNVFEWVETLVHDADRGMRGGSWNWTDGQLRASQRNDATPTVENPDYGFRVAMVPEPSGVLGPAGGLVSLLAIRRRRARA